MQLDDGMVSDGRVETYTRCVEAICGSAETFFTSVFAAQGKRQLSTYRNAEIDPMACSVLLQGMGGGLACRAKMGLRRQPVLAGPGPVPSDSGGRLSSPLTAFSQGTMKLAQRLGRKCPFCG